MRLLLILMISLSWGQDVPFTIKSTEADQDLGGINQNLKDLTDRKIDKVGGTDVPGDTCFDNPTFCVDATNHEVKISTILFSDGTRQSTAGGGSSGSGASLTANQTWTGQNAIGSQTYTLAVTSKASGNFNNMWMVVASTRSYNGTTSGLIFTGLQSNTWYRLHWSRLQNSAAGRMDFTFNGSQGLGNDYKWVAYGLNSNAGATVSSASDSTDECKTTGAGSEMLVGDVEIGHMDILAQGATVYAHGQTSNGDGNPFLVGQSFHCRFMRATDSTLYEFRFNLTGGNIDGFIFLEQLIVPTL